HGPSRNRPAHAARSAPYPATSLSSRSGPTSEGQPPTRRGATVEQINAHLRNDDGSLRTQKEVASALHAAGWGASNARITAQRQAAGGARTTRIAAQLQAAGGARYLPGATVEQINAHLHNDDGSLRTQKDVASALHAAGWGASTTRIAAQLQAAGGARTTRIAAQLHAAGGARYLPGATVEQINAHLRNDDGSLRTQKDVASALHAAGWGASAARIAAQLQAAREAQ
ncbi:hypothetical protein EAH72_35085, partial [Pseudomonas caspiana]